MRRWSLPLVEEWAQTEAVGPCEGKCEMSTVEERGGGERTYQDEEGIRYIIAKWQEMTERTSPKKN
jgi:hypothetical protein